MTEFNMPPGVSTRDIPGNEPEHTLDPKTLQRIRAQIAMAHRIGPVYTSEARNYPTNETNRVVL